MLSRDVQAFHEKFELAYDGTPRQLPRTLRQFRIKFLQEELDEYSKATRKADLAGQLDALVDLVYVALGTAHLQGFDFDEAWRRVHEANMSKVRAKSRKQSKRRSTLDVVKPDGWQAPSMEGLV